MPDMVSDADKSIDGKSVDLGVAQQTIQSEVQVSSVSITDPTGAILYNGDGYSITKEQADKIIKSCGYNLGIAKKVGVAAGLDATTWNKVAEAIFVSEIETGKPLLLDKDGNTAQNIIDNNALSKIEADKKMDAQRDVIVQAIQEENLATNKKGIKITADEATAIKAAFNDNIQEAKDFGSRLTGDLPSKWNKIVDKVFQTDGITASKPWEVANVQNITTLTNIRSEISKIHPAPAPTH